VSSEQDFWRHSHRRGSAGADARARREMVRIPEPCARFSKQFLQVGPDRTFKEPPERMPDTQHSIVWRYVRVGVVDLEAGKIVEA